jgi:hypothetical protein
MLRRNTEKDNNHFQPIRRGVAEPPDGFRTDTGRRKGLHVCVLPRAWGAHAPIRRS